MATNPKRPRDPLQLGKFIVDLATGQAEDVPLPGSLHEEPAVLLGRRGGAARAAKMTSEERSAAAKKAAAARWAKK